MNKAVALQFLGAVCVSLALLSIAATCPTAKTGQTNCGPSVDANCHIVTDYPPHAPSYCVAESTQHNRAPGICTSPYNQANDCVTTAGNVAVTYTAYQYLTYTNGTCDCNLQVTVWTDSFALNCPVTANNGSTDPCNGG